jgi:hypothetical protein
VGTEHTHPEQASEAAPAVYEPPRIVAYDEAALLDLIGPAVACARWTGVGSARRRDEPGDDE